MTTPPHHIRTGDASTGNPGPLLPTPNASYDTGRHGSRTPDHRRAVGVQMNLADLAEKGPLILPTPTSRDWKGRNQRNTADCMPVAAETMAESGFGRYMPAIRRWERRMGPVPDPVVCPDTLIRAVTRLPDGLVDGRLIARNLTRQGRFRFPGPGMEPPSFQPFCRRLLRFADPGRLDGRGLPDPMNRILGYVPGRWCPPPVVVDLWRDTWTATGRRIPAIRNLNPVFVEWMMGLPAGWVTDPRIWGRTGRPARALQLRALGNGVVPVQAETAVTWALTVRERHSRPTTDTGKG